MQMVTKLYHKLHDSNVTMYAVARKGNWSWQQVADWCKGKRKPSLRTFMKLKDILSDFGIQVDLSDLENIGL